MTRESYINYVLNIKNYVANYAKTLADKISIGACDVEIYNKNLILLNQYVEILESYTLVDTENEEDYIESGSDTTIYTDNNSDLVTNGSFDTDLSGWTLEDASFLWNDALWYNGLGVTKYAYQDILTVGNYYRITLDASLSTGGEMQISTGGYDSFFYTESTDSTSAKYTSTQSIDIVLKAESTELAFGFNHSNSIVIDNVTCKLLSKTIPFTNNVLTVAQMKAIVEDINRILTLNYCLDFNLTGLYN